MVFGAANTYLGLLAGLTISTSIPVAVLVSRGLRISGGQTVTEQDSPAQPVRPPEARAPTPT